MRAIPIVLVPLLAAAPLFAQEEVRAPHEVDSGPVLLGCDHLAPAVASTVVPVRFVVDAAGTVVPSSVRAERRVSQRFRSFQTISSDLALRAQEAALSCAYDPARIDGRPVAVRMQADFAFEDPPSDGEMRRARDRAVAAKRRG